MEKQSPLTVDVCLDVIASTSISVRDFKKLASDIIPFADFQETSLIPFITTIHSHTTCTGLGGFANDLSTKVVKKSMGSFTVECLISLCRNSLSEAT